MTKNYLTGASLAGYSATRERVDNDFYATPPESTIALLEREVFEGNILEPCCGQGHISEVLKDNGYSVISNDLVDRGYGEHITKIFLSQQTWKQITLSQILLLNMLKNLLRSR